MAERKTKDPITDFFEGLAARGHEPLLEQATGTIRFDLVDGKRTEHWFVAIRKGEVTVSHKNARADCVARSDRGTFERIVRGEQNAMAAMLRGAVAIDGNPAPLALFQRLFPGPAASRRRAAARARARA